jgi:8-oxo-dGTP pyrophosphatase MutT (NUDIX family)
MVSIGCNVLEEETVQIGTHKVPVYTRTELLECSLVIIGSNRGALKLDRSRVAAMLREVGGVGGVVKAAEAAPPAAPAPATVPQRRSLDDKQVSTVAVIAPGHMLWGKRRDDGKWTTPGGHLHPGESPVDGAVRELAEESGIIVTADKLKPLGAVTNAKGVRIHTFRLDVPKMISPTVKRDPDKEIEVWEWVPFESGRLPQHILSNLHAQPNAIVAALRLDRDVMGAGGPALDTLLTTTVYGGDGLDFFGDDDDMLKVRDDGETTPSSDSSSSASLTPTPDVNISSSTSTPPQPLRFSTRGVVSHKSYPTIEQPWDADAAVQRWRKWASSDGSGDKDKIDWAKYAQCFLYVRPE